VSQHGKLLLRVLAGQHDAAIRFADLRRLLLALGFDERVRGSHHLFVRVGVAELVNIQQEGSLAKPYQVRQVRQIIVKYRLGEVDA
jgi:predicted RNA binding protein YcfA (HicA-like mRNA interferase family)